MKPGPALKYFPIQSSIDRALGMYRAQIGILQRCVGFGKITPTMEIE